MSKRSGGLLNQVLQKNRERGERRRHTAVLERLARAIEGRPPQPEDRLDEAARDMRQAYDDILTETGKPPSQRTLAKRAGYSREAVRRRWHLVKNQAK